VKHIENWLNSSVSTITGYVPIELLNGESRPDLFGSVLDRQADNLPVQENIPEKVLRAYARMKLKANQRNQKR
jgi:hypothetical protein